MKDPQGDKIILGDLVSVEKPWCRLNRETRFFGLPAACSDTMQQPQQHLRAPSPLYRQLMLKTSYLRLVEFTISGVTALQGGRRTQLEPATHDILPQKGWICVDQLCQRGMVYLEIEFIIKLWITPRSSPVFLLFPLFQFQNTAI